VKHLLLLEVLPPRWLEVSRRASNRVVSHGKFVQVVLCLRKGTSKLSEAGKWLEEDPTHWKGVEIDS
jgi:hypothetical protein